MMVEKVTRLDEVKRLWKECFGDPDEYMEFYFDWKVRDNEMFGIYEDHRLVSMLHLNPYLISMNGRDFRSYYIVGVATDENYRKRGLMRKVLNESLKIMYQRKIPFTYLMPASEAIYLPFDFRIITTQRRKSIPIKQMIGQQSVSHTTYEFLELASHIDKISDVVDYANDMLAKRENVYTIRDAYYYQRMLCELATSQGDILAAYHDGVCKGYLAYVIEDQKVEVIECLSGVKIEEALLDELVKVVLEKTKHETVEEKTPTTAPPMMARILHLQTFLEQIRSSEEVTLTLNVEDPVLTENTGVYQMKCSPRECQVVKLDEQKAKDAKIDISGSIADMTLFFFGKPSEVKYLEKSHKVDKKINSLKCLERVYLNEIV